jgi:hypothetical protein
VWQKPDEDDVSWNRRSEESSSKGPHPDYDYNLQVSLNFVAKVSNSLPHGMKVVITGSHGLEQSLLMVSWMPAREAKQGNWANPIFLHQARRSFAKALETVFNRYVRKAETFERKSL